ncbi:MAG: DUF952 domain-containing protein [Bacteroidota bacterium]
MKVPCDAPRTIYKICPREIWDEARRIGSFRGSADDARDGYIHLSAPDQVAGTLARHFAGQADLVLIGVDAARLGPALKWELSRGGALFPHLYAPLQIETVVSERVLTLGADGRHRLPEDLG